MAVIVNGDGILTGISSLATALTDLNTGRGTVTGVATVGTLQLGAGVSISSPRSQQAAIFTNNTEFLTIDDAGRVGVGTITPNSDAHPENEKKINVGFVTAKSVAGDIDARNVVVAGVSTFVNDVYFDGATAGRDIIFDRSDNRLEFEENAKAAFGAGGADMQIYSDGSNPIIYAGTNTLRVVADNIHFEAGDFGDEFLRCTHDGGVSLYYDNSLKLTTASSGINVTGEVRPTSHIVMNSADNQIIYLGASNDLKLYHNGTHSFLQDSGTGNLMLATSALQVTNADVSETMIYAVDGGAVNLYHNNIKTFETTSDGIQVEGPEGSAASIQLYSDEGDDNADKWRIYNTGGDFFKVQTYKSGSWQDTISAQSENQVRLFYNGSEKLNTGNHGISITGKIYMNNGNVQFYAGGTGISFQDTSDHGSTTPATEVLDDYEEGTWTPTLESTSTNPTIASYQSQHGRYTKIGNVVHLFCYMDISAGNIGGTLTGDGVIGGLPYTISNNPGSSDCHGSYSDNIKSIPNTFSSQRNNAMLFFGNGEAQIRIHQYSTVNPIYQTGWGMTQIANGNRFKWGWTAQYRTEQT